jgi:esterase/lipase
MRHIILFLLITVALLIAGCTSESNTTASTAEEQSVRFTTIDDWSIRGTLYNSNGNSVLLLHGLGDHRTAWVEFARVLQDKGYKVLAIDMRGHGESTLKGSTTKTWEQFTVQDYASMAKDLSAAQEFLGEKNISIIGASIGANIALNYAAGGKVSSLVLLSPGLNYHDIKAEPAMRLYKGPVYIAAADMDQYSADSASQLYRLASGEKELEITSGSSHGTVLLEDVEMQDAILAWLADNYPAAKPVDNSTNITTSRRRY